MLLLDAATKKLQVQLGEAIATTQCDWTLGYSEYQSTPAITGAPADGQTNGVAAVDMLAGPATGFRIPRCMSVYNADTIPHWIRILYYNGSATRVIVAKYVQPGASLLLGFKDTDSIPPTVDNKFLKSPGFDAANLTATLSCTSGTMFALHMGRAARPVSSVNMRYRVTTAAVTITWAEVALYAGPPVLAGNPTLARKGWTDVSGVVNSTGQKTTSITAAVVPGEDLWLCVSVSATTALVVRAGLADDLQMGWFASIAATRPSLTAGCTPTLGGATTALPWFGLDY